MGRAEDFGVKLWSESWQLGELHTPLMLDLGAATGNDRFLHPLPWTSTCGSQHQVPASSGYCEVGSYRISVMKLVVLATVHWGKSRGYRETERYSAMVSIMIQLSS